MVFSVRLQTGEIIPTGYPSSDFEPLDDPSQEIPLTNEKYLQIAKQRKCGTCGKNLEVWEINVNIVNYYSKYYNNKRGRIRFICYGCVQ